MKATARRSNCDLEHQVEIRSFRFPLAPGATREGTPTPTDLLAASLAACSAEAIDTYARTEGWEIGDVVVEVECQMAQRAHQRVSSWSFAYRKAFLAISVGA